MDKNYQEIITKLNEIENKLNMLISKIDKDINPPCEQMSRHINFIEDTYSKLKYPLEFISNKIGYSDTNLSLPEPNKN